MLHRKNNPFARARNQLAMCLLVLTCVAVLHPSVLLADGNEQLQMAINSPGSPQPQCSSDPNPPVQCGNMDLVFLVDTTGSVGDLSTLTNELRCVLRHARNRANGNLRAGLVTFASCDSSSQYDGITVIRSLTSDIDLVDEDLRTLAPGPGSGKGSPEASDEALREVVSESMCCVNGNFQKDWRGNCRKIAILATDNVPGGCDDVFQTTGPGNDVDNAHQRALEAAALGIKIGAVQLGTDVVAMEPIMRDYATTTRGRYVQVAHNGAG